MSSLQEFLRMPVWYPALSGYTFPTVFVRLRPDEVAALAAGDVEHAASVRVISELRAPMAATPGNCFIGTDCCAPTDTERFELRRGAIYSPESAWKTLCASEKVRLAAARGEVEYIVVKPFRRMNRTREFRLFLYEGRLVAMSQYNLDRHFRRLEGIKSQLWEMALAFFDNVSWLLPGGNLVMDVYLTGEGQFLIVDLNNWGAPTDPLLLRKWTREDWDATPGIILMPPPTRISGEVQVSF